MQLTLSASLRKDRQLIVDFLNGLKGDVVGGEAGQSGEISGATLVVGC